jgi:hypothetical protein
VADEIGITVCACQLEVPIVGRQPRVEHVRDGDAPVSKNQRAWRLLAAMAGVALDTNAEEPFCRQLRSPNDVDTIVVREGVRLLGKRLASSWSLANRTA